MKLILKTAISGNGYESYRINYINPYLVENLPKGTFEFKHDEKGDLCLFLECD